MDERLVGVWRLLSFELKISTGEVVYPVGRDTRGMLVYDEHGNMAAQIMRVDRPVLASNDQLRGSDAEVRAAFEGYLAYYGSYEVVAGGTRVVHRVIGSLFANWIGTEQVRLIRFDGDRLALATEPLSCDGREMTAEMTWERVTSIARGEVEAQAEPPERRRVGSAA